MLRPRLLVSRAKRLGGFWCDLYVREKILDGSLVVRGRLPNEIPYKTIDRTYWRSSVLTFVPDPVSLWRMEIAPVWGFTIEPDGRMKTGHKPSAKRNAAIRKYDSLLVDAYEFESLWPAKEQLEDKKRKQFLKKAKKAGLDKQTIKSLS